MDLEALERSVEEFELQVKAMEDSSARPLGSFASLLMVFAAWWCFASGDGDMGPSETTEANSRSSDEAVSSTAAAAQGDSLAIVTQGGSPLLGSCSEVKTSVEEEGGKVAASSSFEQLQGVF